LLVSYYLRAVRSRHRESAAVGGQRCRGQRCRGHRQPRPGTGSPRRSPGNTVRL